MKESDFTKFEKYAKNDLRSENGVLDTEKLQDLYGKSFTTENEETHKLRFYSDMEMHKKYLSKLGEKNSKIEEKIKEAAKFSLHAEELDKKIEELSKRLSKGGILPVEKENLMNQLKGLTIIRDAVRKNAYDANDEISMLMNQSEGKKITPGGNIHLN